MNQIVRGSPPPPSQAPYVFREYPKHVYPNGEGMPFVRVDSAEQEAEVMATGKLVDPEEEKTRLLAVAAQHGLALDGRWKIERMRKALSAAGYDPDHNPFA